MSLNDREPGAANAHQTESHSPCPLCLVWIEWFHPSCRPPLPRGTANFPPVDVAHVDHFQCSSSPSRTTDPLPRSAPDEIHGSHIITDRRSTTTNTSTNTAPISRSSPSTDCLLVQTTPKQIGMFRDTGKTLSLGLKPRPPSRLTALPLARTSCYPPFVLRSQLLELDGDTADGDKATLFPSA